MCKRFLKALTLYRETLKLSRRAPGWSFHPGAPAPCPRAPRLDFPRANLRRDGWVSARLFPAHQDQPCDSRNGSHNGTYDLIAPKPGRANPEGIGCHRQEQDDYPAHEQDDGYYPLGSHLYHLPSFLCYTKQRSLPLQPRFLAAEAFQFIIAPPVSLAVLV